MRPNLAFVRTPVWDQAEPDTQEGFGELVDALGAAVDDVELPKPFEQAHAMHGAIMRADLARNFARYYDNGRDRMSDREFNDLVFVPGRDQDRCRAVERTVAQLPAIHRHAPRAAGQSQPDPRDVDRQFVECTEQEKDRGEQKQLVLDERKPLQRRNWPHSGSPLSTTGALTLMPGSDLATESSRQSRIP